MEKVKIGVIGCGMISEIYLKNCKDVFRNIEVVACADIIQEVAKKRADQFGITECSVEELLANPEIELVLNLTIPSQHAKIGMKALKAGKHVYSEKPLAISKKEGEELLAFAKEKNLLVGCAPDTFLGGGLQTCRKLIDDGLIGAPIAAQAFMLSRGPESFHPNPEFFYKKGAGPLLDWGPYYITALISLLGPIKKVSGMAKATYPEREVLAAASPKKGEKFSVDVPTYVTSLLNFENGVIANLTTTFDLQFPYFNSKMPYIQIYGTKGTLTVPDTNKFEGPVILRKGGEEPEEVALSFGFTENSRGMGLSDMANAIRTKENYRAKGQLALHVAEIMFGILESAETGKVYDIENTCEQPEILPAKLPAYLYE